MSPSQTPASHPDLLSRDLTEEMLEELAILALEAQEDDEEHHMPKQEAIEVAVLVQATILDLEWEERPNLPPKG